MAPRETETVRPVWSSAAVAGYLRALRPILTSVTEDRQAFIHRIGGLMESVRQGDAAGFGAGADEIGLESAERFHYSHARLVELQAPSPSCDPCHEAVATWISMLAGTADALGEIGRAGDTARVREVQLLLAESRISANRFRGEYEQLIERLRQRVATKSAQKRTIGQMLHLRKPS